MAKIYVQNSSIYGVGETVVGQVRKANEDNCGYASTENGELFVVCDGMGGHVGGATASKIGVESIINYISTHKHADKRVILRDALVFANMQILGTASADATLKGMGTTACIVLIEGDNAWLAHVGDSRIYLYSQKDKFLYRVSKDHSFVQGLVDSGQLDDRDAENHPQKNIILRALGIKEDMKPEVDAEPMHCAKGDIIMICSDGLSGMIDDVYIEKKIRDNKADLADLCQQLIDDANTPDKGKDNITCQLIRFEKAAAGAPKHPDFTPKWRRPGSAVAGAATAAVAGPAPEPKSKKMLWIGLAVLVILLAGGIVGGMMYLRNNMHFFTASHTKTIRLTDNDSLNLGDKKLGLVKETAVIRKWYSDSITVRGVHLSEDGVLTLDSSYNALGVEVKAEGEYKGKVFKDAIWISLEYVKLEKPIPPIPDPDTITQRKPLQPALTIDPIRLELKPGEEHLIKATVISRWRSNDMSIATLSSDEGTSVKVKAHKEGNAIIIVTSADGQSKKCNVVVKKVQDSPDPALKEKKEYALMVRPIVVDEDYTLKGNYITRYGVGKEIVNFNECLVYVVQVKGGKDVPSNAQNLEGTSWRTDDVVVTPCKSVNGAYWYKCSIKPGGDGESVFSFVYKDEKNQDQKISIQLKD